MIRTAIACFLCGSLIVAPFTTGLSFGQTVAADAVGEARLDFGRFAELSSTEQLDEAATTELLQFFGSSTQQYHPDHFLPTAALPLVLCHEECSGAVVDTWIANMMKKFKKRKSDRTDVTEKSEVELVALAADKNAHRALRIAVTLYLDRLGTADAADATALVLLLDDPSFQRLSHETVEAESNRMPQFRADTLRDPTLSWIGKLQRLNEVLLLEDAKLSDIKAAVEALRKTKITIPFMLSHYQIGDGNFETHYSQFSNCSYPQQVRSMCLAYYLADIRGRFEALANEDLESKYEEFVPSSDFMLSLALCCDNIEELLSARAYSFDWHRYCRVTKENCSTLRQPCMSDIELILQANQGTIGSLEPTAALLLVQKLNRFGERFRAYTSNFPAQP